MFRFPFKSKEIKAAFLGSRILHDEADVRAMIRMMDKASAEAFELGYLAGVDSTRLLFVGDEVRGQMPLRIVGGRDHGNDAGEV